MFQPSSFTVKSKSGTNPQHQRFHFVGVQNVGGEFKRVFEPTGLITVRSLASVGGTRGKKQFTRRKNRQAQARGFRNFKAMLQHMMALHAQQARAAGIR